MSSISLSRFFGAIAHIFGPSGAGKSVVASELSDKLKTGGYDVTYFSSGDGFRALVKDSAYVKDPVVRKIELDMNAGVMLDEDQNEYMKERVFTSRLTTFIERYILSGGKAQLITDGLLRSKGQDAALWKNIQTAAAGLLQNKPEYAGNDLLRALTVENQDASRMTKIMLEGSPKIIVDIDCLKADSFIKLREMDQLDRAIRELDDSSPTIQGDKVEIRAFLSEMRDRLTQDRLTNHPPTHEKYDPETDISTLTRSKLSATLGLLAQAPGANQEIDWTFAKAMRGMGFRHIPRADGMTPLARSDRVNKYGTVSLSEAGVSRSGAIWYNPGAEIGSNIVGWCDVNMELDTGIWGLNDPTKEGTYIIKNRTDQILDPNGQIDRDTRPLLREQVSRAAEKIMSSHRALELQMVPVEGGLTGGARK